MSDGNFLQTLGESLSFDDASREGEQLSDGADIEQDVSDTVAEAREAAIEVRAAGAGEMPESAIETAQSQVVAMLVAKAHGAGRAPSVA